MTFVIYSSILIVGLIIYYCVINPIKRRMCKCIDSEYKDLYRELFRQYDSEEILMNSELLFRHNVILNSVNSNMVLMWYNPQDNYVYTLGFVETDENDECNLCILDTNITTGNLFLENLVYICHNSMEIECVNKKKLRKIKNFLYKSYINSVGISRTREIENSRNPTRECSRFLKYRSRKQKLKKYMLHN